MSRLRNLASIAAAALGISLLGACGTDSITEFGLEQFAEAQVDGDVDLDFGDEGFNITTEDGSFSFNLDGEDGSFSFDGVDGAGTVNFDEDGTIVFDTDEGSGVINVDEDGSIAYDTDEGQGTIQFNGDDEGGFTFEDEDGSTSFSSSQNLPADWPAFVPVPTTLDPTTSSFTVIDDADTGRSFSGVFSHDPNEAYREAVAASLEAAGFTAGLTSPGFSIYEGNGYAVTVTGEGGDTVIAITPGA